MADWLPAVEMNTYVKPSAGIHVKPSVIWAFWKYHEAIYWYCFTLLALIQMQCFYSSFFTSVIRWIQITRNTFFGFLKMIPRSEFLKHENTGMYHEFILKMARAWKQLHFTSGIWLWKRKTNSSGCCEKRSKKSNICSHKVLL